MGFFQAIAHKITAMLAIFVLGGGVASMKPAPLPVSASLVESVAKPVADDIKPQAANKLMRMRLKYILR